MSTTTIQRIHPHSQVRAVDRDKLEIDVIASTDKIDSYSSTIDPTGWDLEQFKRNPQILWAHDDRGFTPSAGLPVANAIPGSIRVEGNKLLMRLRFTPKETNEFGYTVFRLIADGFLHGLSVGFEPVEEITEDDAEGNRITKYKRQKLLEVSVVTIPANDDALVMRARSLNREKDVEEIKRIATDVETMAKAEADKQAAIDTGSMYSKEDIEKWRGYFETKQPINKIASGALKKFYSRILGEEPPESEKMAWQRMSDAIDAIEEQKKPEEPVEVEVEKVEEKPQEAAPVEPSIPTPPAEAPPAEQKASVLIPLEAVGSLPERFRQALQASAEEALRQGIIAVGDVDEFIDRTSKKLLESMLSK